MPTWMKAASLVCLVCVALYGGLQAAAGTEGGRGAVVRAPSIAVVDVEEVTNDYLRSTGDLERRNNQFVGERQALAVLRDTIDSMEQESEVYPKGSTKYLELVTQVAIKKKEYEVRYQSNQANHNRERAKLMREAYDKASGVIANYAKEQGISMVMLKQGGEMKGLSLEEVSSNILVRAIIYNDQQMDITEAIKDRMK